MGKHDKDATITDISLAEEVTGSNGQQQSGYAFLDAKQRQDIVAQRISGLEAEHYQHRVVMVEISSLDDEDMPEDQKQEAMMGHIAEMARIEKRIAALVTLAQSEV